MEKRKEEREVGRDRTRGEKRPWEIGKRRGWGKGMPRTGDRVDVDARKGRDQLTGHRKRAGDGIGPRLQATCQMLKGQERRKEHKDCMPRKRAMKESLSRREWKIMETGSFP